MALPEDPNAKKRRDNVAPSPDLLSHTPTPPPPPIAPTQMTAVPDSMTEASAPPPPLAVAADAGEEGAGGGAVADAGSGGTISLSVDDLMQYAQPASYEQQAADLEERLAEGASTTVPVGMDEFMMPEPRTPPARSPDSPSLPKQEKGEEEGDPHNDSGEFPDLLDSDIDYNKFSARAGSAKVKEEETGLTFATLSGVCPEYPKAKKSAPAPEPPRVEISAAEGTVADAAGAEDADRKQTQDLVTALASEAVAQLAKANITLPAGTCLVPAASGGDEGGAEGEAVAKQIASMTGVQMAPTTEGAALAAASASSSSVNFPNKPMTITIQYKIYPDAQGTPQTVAVKRDLAELINEAPLGGAGAQVEAAGPSSATTGGDAAVVAAAAPMATADAEEPPPIVVQPPMNSISAETAPAAVEPKPVPVQPAIGGELHASSVPPIPVNANQPDYFKDTVWVMTPAGQKFEVPRIVTGGYDLDQLMCITCSPPKVFKNDKTLMGHMLSHFGVAPKMARCPLCGLTLQKKSYARHIRLHGEKGTLQSQPSLQEAQVVQLPSGTATAAVTTIATPTTVAITPAASVSAGPPQVPATTLAAPTATATVMFPCSYCEQAFFSEVELQTHTAMHMSQLNQLNPQMVYSPAGELSTPAKLHTGSRPHVCEICESRFSNERDKSKHVLRHQGSMPYRCRTCSLTFQSQAHLDKHAASHTKGTQVVSAKINTFLESFSAALENDLISLDGDDDVASPADPRRIDASGQNDNVPEELLADADSGEASLTCAICSTRLKNKRSFMIHMRRHAGLLNFKCRFCPKTFQGQVKLNRHLRKHAREGTDVSASASAEDEIETTAVISTGQGYTISYGGGNKLERGAKAAMKKKTAGAVSIETTKCALCPKTFTDNEALAAHTKVGADLEFILHLLKSKEIFILYEAQFLTCFCARNLRVERIALAGIRILYHTVYVDSISLVLFHLLPYPFPKRKNNVQYAAICGA